MDSWAKEVNLYRSKNPYVFIPYLNDNLKPYLYQTTFPQSKNIKKKNRKRKLIWNKS